MTDDKPISKLDEVEYSEDYPVPELDLDRYRPYLEDDLISQEDADEFLVTLWDIMQILVDLGLGMDTVRQFLEHNADFSGQDSENTVLLNTFNNQGDAND